MKKILTGILGLFLTIGVVAGAGYALFSSKVTMSGMVLGTVSPSLLISYDDEEFSPSFTLPGYSLFAKLLPGESDWGEFYLKNASDGTKSDLLDFDIKGKITGAGGDWGYLKDAVQMDICIYDEAAVNNCKTDARTGFHTLAQWYASEYSLPGGILAQDETRHYTIVFYIHPSFTNAIAGKTITGMNMEITGTQHP